MPITYWSAGCTSHHHIYPPASTDIPDNSLAAPPPPPAALPDPASPTDAAQSFPALLLQLPHERSATPSCACKHQAPQQPTATNATNHPAAFHILTELSRSRSPLPAPDITDKPVPAPPPPPAAVPDPASPTSAAAAPASPAAALLAMLLPRAVLLLSRGQVSRPRGSLTSPDAVGSSSSDSGQSSGTPPSGSLHATSQVKQYFVFGRQFDRQCNNSSASFQLWLATRHTSLHTSMHSST
jgi:hypothetical protein